MPSYFLNAEYTYPLSLSLSISRSLSSSSLKHTSNRLILVAFLHSFRSFVSWKYAVAAYIFDSLASTVHVFVLLLLLLFDALVTLMPFVYLCTFSRAFRCNSKYSVMHFYDTFEIFCSAAVCSLTHTHTLNLPLMPRVSRCTSVYSRCSCAFFTHSQIENVRPHFQLYHIISYSCCALDLFLPFFFSSSIHFVHNLLQHSAFSLTLCIDFVLLLFFCFIYLLLKLKSVRFALDLPHRISAPTYTILMPSWTS